MVMPRMTMRFILPMRVTFSAGTVPFFALMSMGMSMLLTFRVLEEADIGLDVGTSTLHVIRIEFPKGHGLMEPFLELGEARFVD